MEGSVLTPWGRSDQLRDRRLRPGPGKERADVERNHRERLYGAMVAVIDENGYERMSVGAVAERAGVSRSAVYEYFSGGQECFIATFDTLLRDGLRTVEGAYEVSEGAWDTRLAIILDTLFAILVAQPAASRLCFLETYAAGSDATALRDHGVQMLEGLVADTFEQSPERRGMPPDVTGALMGGIRTVAQSRLRRRQERELPAIAADLLNWVTLYRRPSSPLRQVPYEPMQGRFVATSHRDRLFVALAEVVGENGYANTIVFDIVTTAGVSLSTFYDNFEGKEAAFVAACDYGIDQAFTAARAAWERESPNGWPDQVRAGMRELLSFLASEPKWSRMAMVEIFAAGPRARARRDRTIELFVSLLEPGRSIAPDLPPIVLEVLGGAIYSLMYRQICNRGAEHLPEILSPAVFVLLTPFVGSDEAAAIANRP
jgi:AcrR family transcriptional regulator